MNTTRKRERATKLFSLLWVLLLLVSACSSQPKKERVLDVELVVPTSNVSQGRVFDLQLVLTNPGLYNVHITRIVLPKEIMNSSRYVGSEPALTLVRNEIGEGLIEMDLTIAPTGQENFLFRFEAFQSGTLKGTGMVKTDEQDYPFTARVDVAGVNPEGWQPGTSPLTTPTALNPIPWSAVVLIEAIIEIDGVEMVGWTGSGTIISSDGLILTNAHVVLSDRFYQVKNLVVSLTVAEDAPPVPTYRASIVQADEALDIAVIKPYQDLNGNALNYSLLNLPFVPLGDSDELSLGATINILGYPGIGGDTITLTRGEVSGFTSEAVYGNRAFIKTSGTIAGGNSGGLAVNERGELIGVPTAVGSGDLGDAIVDCRALMDTNRDGYIDDNDTCVPTGGFINALRPINLAMDLIRAARAGEVAIAAGNAIGEAFTPGGQVIFEDDFSDPKSGWNTIVDAEGERRYENGEYAIRVTEPMYLVWSDQEYLYDPIVIEADVRVLESVGDADYGFICGLVDNDHFYVLEISEDGFYTIWKQDGKEIVSLVDWSYSQEIVGGGDFRLSAQCGSEQLVLALDGMVLASVTDPGFKPGGVGMLAGTFEIAGFKVAFDNLRLLIE
ncbi:MAG: serine protease [Anaerolineaceae bacterium]|nr:serine protease [Anaerolineaceae bacterium]MDD4043109.1 serine protease [Anaerolineaceae bacterium]MDD4576985.1 serine protease [Anaerolineaceae bacterium]